MKYFIGEVSAPDSNVHWMNGVFMDHRRFKRERRRGRKFIRTGSYCGMPVFASSKP